MKLFRSNRKLLVILKLLILIYFFPACSPNVILTVVAAHPRIPTQFAVGLSDGSAYIVEPRTEDKARWGPLPLDEYGSFRAIVEGNTEENQNSHFTVD